MIVEKNMKIGLNNFTVETLVKISNNEILIYIIY